MRFNEIRTGTEEGKLLLASLAIITTLPGYTDKTPDEVLNRVKEVAAQVYKGGC